MKNCHSLQSRNPRGLLRPPSWRQEGIRGHCGGLATEEPLLAGPGGLSGVTGSQNEKVPQERGDDEGRA